jgi:tubulin-specific chaperone D
MYNALISGLEDYTTDERGDVGSWVRIASIQGLTSVSLTLLTLAKSGVTYTEYIPANLYQKAIGGILKQGVERLDNVRQQAGQSVIRLLSCPVHSNAWKFHGEELFKGLLLRYELSDFVFSQDVPYLLGSDAAEDGASISHGWQDSSWIFPKAMQFLQVPEYRPAVLAGLLISVGSKTESTVNGMHIRRSISAFLTTFFFFFG